MLERHSPHALADRSEADEAAEPAPRRPVRPTSLHGWSFVEEARKREILDALCGAGADDSPPGPVHAELDLTDRCNVACYFCNQMDVRTKDALPFEQVERLVEDLVAGGLRSVRLSGGGDPLMYPDVVRAFDLFADRGVTVDNLTTNAALMGPEVADRLVRHGAREVMVSLNAVDAQDYSRMMKVAPKIFDRVLDNVRHLLELRGEGPSPAVTLQFLIDRESYRRLEEMVELGRSLGVDRIAINAVLDIPNDRLADAPLLWAGDRQLVRPYLRRALGRAFEAGVEDRLHLSFPWEPWNEMVDALRTELAGGPKRPYPVAESFRPDLDHCFFGWYSAAIRGTGEMYPCCMLINPDYEPIGDLRQGSFDEQWRGEGFTTLRREMREVFLRDGRIEADRMEALRPQCVETGRCGLKSMFFRGDEAFYRELGEAMDRARRREMGWSGGWAGRWTRLGRSAGVLAYRLRWGLWSRWTRLREAWQRLRNRRLPLLVRGARIHVGTRERGGPGGDDLLQGWVRVGLHGEPWADRSIAPGAAFPYPRAKAIHLERVLETLGPDEARAVLVRARGALAEDGVLRVAAQGGASARWSAAELEAELRAAGFGAIEHLSYGRSPRPWLRNLEDHPVGEDSPEHPGTIVLEAARDRGAFHRSVAP